VNSYWYFLNMSLIFPNIQKYGMASHTVSPDTEFKIQKKVLAKRKASYKYGRFLCIHPSSLSPQNQQAVWKIIILHEISRYWPHLSTSQTTKYLFNTIKPCLGFREELRSKSASSPLHSKCIKTRTDRGLTWFIDCAVTEWDKTYGKADSVPKHLATRVYGEDTTWQEAGWPQILLDPEVVKREILTPLLGIDQRLWSRHTVNLHS
jgi:hypothetical protein